MRRLWIPFVLVLFLVPIAGCGGAGSVGEACSSPGSSDDCVEGAICAQDQSTMSGMGDPVWDTYTCRAICLTQAECAGDLECRGVTGSPTGERACQPARTSSP